MIARDDHWFDRLTERQSRGQLLKTALAGAVLTLPFARSAEARVAFIPCEQGCFYAAGKRQDRELAECAQKQNACTAGLFNRLHSIPVLNGAVFQLASSACLKLHGAKTAACYDQAILQKKATNWDCIKPDCPDFDPEGPDGPCEEWVKLGLKCCPDPSSPVGYCPAGQGSCCHPAGKGCASGVTLCGGGGP